MIQQTRGKWSFLEDLGGFVGKLAQQRDLKRKEQKGEAENQADILFKLAQAGALPGGIDGQAVSALQTAGITPDAVFSINKRAKALQAQADEKARLENEHVQQLIEQGKATATYNEARANALATPKPPTVNVKAAMDAVEPFARHPKLTWEESYAQMQTLPAFQGVSKEVVKTYYESAKQKYKEERDKERRIAARGAGSGAGDDKPMPLPTQLNYWQDLARTAVEATRQELAANPQFLQQPPAQQEAFILQGAVQRVAQDPNPKIAAQFQKGLNIAHFRAALAAAQKGAGKKDKGSALERAMSAVGGTTPAPSGVATGGKSSGAPRKATEADWDAAVAATGGANSTREKATAWLQQQGIVP